MNEETSQEKKQEQHEEATPTIEETSGENQENKADDFDQKIRELNDKYLRLYSEFENFRKRSAREKAELIMTAGGDTIKELLPVLDDFERAIKHNSQVEDPEQLKKGFELIHQKLDSNLRKKGLEPMDCMGKDFDPELHEALTKIPAPDDSLKGKVVDVIENGYYLNGKVIRYAKVVVGE